MPYKVWITGEEVLAADFNDYLQEQVIATFANAALRDAAITAPNAGQMVYLADRQMLTKYDGTGWRDQAVETWTGYLAASGNITPTAAPGLAVPVLTATVPPGDYLLTVTMSILVPANAAYQNVHGFYRGTTATLVGNQWDSRVPAPTGPSGIASTAGTVIDRAVPGGATTWGIAAFCPQAANSQLRNVMMTAQRVRAMN